MPAPTCPNCCSTTEVKLKPHLIIAGSITFIVGLIDLGVNGVVFSYLTNYFYGAWWSALMVMITGFLGMMSVRRGVVVAACAVSVVSIMMAFAGIVVDGVGNTQMDSIQTCASASSYYAVDDYVYYGDAAYNSDAMTCIQTYYTADTDCYCVDSETNCFFLNGQSDCGLILTSYITNLKVSVGMDVLAFMCVLSFFVVTCFSICCPYGFRKKTSTFKNTLRDDDRGSTTTNPLQNSSRPMLSRVATFGNSFKFSGAWNSGEASSNGQSAAQGADLVAAMEMGKSGSGASSVAHTGAPGGEGSGGGAKQGGKTGDVSSFSNPLLAKKQPAPSSGSSAPAPAAAAVDGAFSSSVADFQFAAPPRPAPPAVAPTSSDSGGAISSGGAPPPPPPPPKAPATASPTAQDSTSGKSSAGASAAPRSQSPIRTAAPIAESVASPTTRSAAQAVGSSGMAVNPLARKKIVKKAAAVEESSAAPSVEDVTSPSDDA